MNLRAISSSNKSAVRPKVSDSVEPRDIDMTTLPPHFVEPMENVLDTVIRTNG